jgi:hypothetical protein
MLEGSGQTPCGFPFLPEPQLREFRVPGPIPNKFWSQACKRSPRLKEILLDQLRGSSGVIAIRLFHRCQKPMDLPACDLPAIETSAAILQIS